MISALETTALQLVSRLEKQNCFDSDGFITERDFIHETLNSPHIYVALIDLQSKIHCYLNDRLKERFGVTNNWLDEMDLHLIYMNHSPLSFQHIISEHDRYAGGATNPQLGFINFVADEARGLEEVYCEDITCLVARSSEGKSTYYAHFSCDVNHLDLLAAYAQYDLRDLTPRQRTTLEYLLEGLSAERIAAKMDISLKTLEKHTQVIFQKTGCQNQAALIAAVQGV